MRKDSLLALVERKLHWPERFQKQSYFALNTVFSCQKQISTKSIANYLYEQYDISYFYLIKFDKVIYQPI